MLFLKNLLTSVLSILLFLIFINPLQAQQKTITIQPAKPSPGDTVTITYHPSIPDAVISSPDSLKLILSYAPYLFSQPDEFKMEKSTEGWTTSIPLSDEFKFASFYFTSGDTTDKKPDGHHFEFFAYENGKIVEEGHLMKARSLSERYPDISDKKMDDMRAALYRQELDLYPNSYDSKIQLFAYQLKQENADTTAIRQQAYKIINKRLAKDPGSFNIIFDIKSGYQTIGEKAKGDSVEQAMIEKYPDSDIAMYKRYRETYEMKDEEKKAEIYEKYVNADFDRSYINKYYTGIAYEKLFEYYGKQGELAKMKQIAGLWLQPNPKLLDNPFKSNTYLDAAELIAKHTEEYEWALEYAQKARELTEEEPVEFPGRIMTDSGIKVGYVPDSKKEEYANKKQSKILTVFGLIYSKQGDYKKAEQALKKAMNLSENNTTTEYLAELYQKSDQPQKAFDTYWSILLEEPTDKELHKKLKQSYIAYNGSAKGFKKKSEKLDQVWREKMIEKFSEELIDKAAPSLASITDLNGNPLKVEKLQNKVVVIDFWATWCGPCISAFPHLQNVYDKYKNNREVEFMVLNNAWNNKIEEAREWTKKQDYTFPYYYDKDSKVTEAFGVRGIPTTFVLGKDGNIQFMKRGFEGPKMEPKLSLQINMLLDETDAVTK